MGARDTDQRQDSTLIDLRGRLHDRDVRDLIAASIAGPGSSSVDEVVSTYEQSPQRVLAGIVAEQVLLGVLGGCLLHDGVLLVEVLAVHPDHRRTGIGRRLIDEVADRAGAQAIWADTDGEAVDFYRRCGFSLRPIDEVDGVTRHRAERRHPPEPDGFFTKPKVTVSSPRHVEVELPPVGNTLPLVPTSLRSESVPAFVLAWVLEADEIGLMLQALHPESFPPVTPAVRPVSLAAETGTDAGGEDDIEDLPAGVSVPGVVLRTIAMAERIDRWITAGRRVRVWAESRGHGDDLWIEPETGAGREPRL